MYKNITYFNKQKSIKKYEKKLLESSIFNDIIQTKNGKKEIVYLNSDVLISITKTTVNFLVFNYTNNKIINKIDQFFDFLN